MKRLVVGRPLRSDRLGEQLLSKRLALPLTVLDPPYRDITGPVLDFVAGLRRDAPRELVAVYIPCRGSCGRAARTKNRHRYRALTTSHRPPTTRARRSRLAGRDGPSVSERDR